MLLVVRILYLIPDLEHGGAARQLTLLATGLPRERFEVCVCVLSHGGPLLEPLKRHSIRLEVLGWHRVFDPSSLVRLGRLVRDFRPDVVHGWRPLALRVMGLLPVFGRRRRCVSAPFDLSRRCDQLSWLDRKLVRRVPSLVAFNPREVDWCRRLGVPEQRVVRVLPAVAPQAAPAAKLADVPAEARCIVCIGPLESAKGFRDAVWAFDILRHVADDIHLLLIGAGADRPQLASFIRYSRTGGVVHLLGPRDDVPGLLARAEVVWVPSWRAGGVNAALEAAAAGKPVVATRLPELAEVVADGTTGFLVPVGDKVALARQTRLLLENAARRGEMREAGRRRALEQFTVVELVRRCAGVYEQ
jgi:glycosyltransferase involved in cell wall biosynthesis